MIWCFLLSFLKSSLFFAFSSFCISSDCCIEYLCVHRNSDIFESRVCMCYDVSVSLRSSLFFLTYHKHRIRCIFKFFRKKFSAQIKKYRSHMRKRYFSLLRQVFILFISLILEVKNKLFLTISFFRWHCILFRSTQHYLHYRGFRGAPL